MLPSEEWKARERLLAHIPWFVRATARLKGVRRISLLGSILTNKQNPKDIDFLVMVDDDADLAPPATEIERSIQEHLIQNPTGELSFILLGSTGVLSIAAARKYLSGRLTR